MADDETGSKDRATVALVDAKVATVDAKVDGVKELLQRVAEDVKGLANLAAHLIKVEGRVDDHDRRLKDLEKAQTDDRTYRRVHRPTLILAGAAVLVSVLGIVLGFIVH